MADVAKDDAILTEYIQNRAKKSGQDVGELAAQIDRDALYEHIYALHIRFAKGEFSLGYMAKLLGITKPDLYHLLDAMGLKVTNV